MIASFKHHKGTINCI